jgi:hypothetical protein
MMGSATDGTSGEYGLSVVIGGQHCDNFGRAAALAKIFVVNFGEYYKRSMQYKVNSGYELSICNNLSKTTANPWSIWQVTGPTGCILTSV